MPVFGFKSVADMFDGGGAGKSGGPSSFAGTPFAGGGGGGSSGGGSSLLSGIGSLLGLAVGGPGGAAIGAGLGNLLGGGNINSAFNAGLGTFVAGAGGGPGGVLMNALGGGGAPGGGAGQNILSQLIPGLGGQQPAQGTPGQPAAPGAAPAPAGPLGGLMGLLNSPLVMAALIKATEPKNVSLVSPQERRMMETGERLPDYQGQAMFDYSMGSGYAKGGFVEGPGHGTSDSIPAKIYQNGGPVREARLSDGEFVMTNRAVRGAGGGDRARGAAEMYRMMNQFERRA